MNSATSDFLNFSRWVAAFLVVFGHVYNISMDDYRNVVDPSLPLRAAHYFAGFGHMAVIVFFVISGFLIGGQTILNTTLKSFSMIDYLIHRFSRIYTVLIPALIVSFLIDRLGIQYFNGTGIYTHPDPSFYSNSFGTNMAKHLSFNVFVGNLMQLQTIIVSSLGSNGPLWSLANEWWYYVLFGFCMLAYRSGLMLTRVIAGGAIMATISVLPCKRSTGRAANAVDVNTAWETFWCAIKSTNSWLGRAWSSSGITAAAPDSNAYHIFPTEVSKAKGANCRIRLVGMMARRSTCVVTRSAMP